MVQLSHPYLTTGKAIALPIWTFVSKVMSLLFNILSWFVIVLHPRSKHFLISWLKSLSAVILNPKKIKPDTDIPLTLSLLLPCSACLHVPCLHFLPIGICLTLWHFGFLSFSLAFTLHLLCVCTQSCLTLCTLWTGSCQAPLSVGLSQARML